MTPRKILLLYKISTYEYYTSMSRHGRLQSRELNRFKDTHAAHYRSLEKVERVLQTMELPYKKVTRGQIEDYGGFDMIITVGGDGTFLEAARYSTDQVVLGVNSDPAWSVGRLCSVHADHFADFFEKILSGQLRHRAINRLKIRIPDQGRDVYFLNDVLIAHSNPASLSRYFLTIDAVCEEQRGSGIWISSATGSTSAIFSAGGTEMPPDSQEIQYRPRELYEGWNHPPYRLRGGVLPAATKMILTSLMAEGMVFIDGSHQRFAFGVSQDISIQQAERPLYVF